MFLETVTSEGLAHLSYMIGDGVDAAVIDPRRDIDVYLSIARRHGCGIRHVFETHRNEDYVTGSVELQNAVGAPVYHSRHTAFEYGTRVAEGQQFEVGDLLLRIIETPGHTFDSISIAVYDVNYSGEDAVAVFTGDTLFVGDVGRTDFFPDRAEEVAGLLYDSIFDKLLPLGDQAILCPAHGAGSVCGSGMASREFSTLGYERRHNPVLRIADRREFIQYKTQEHHYKPPYFKRMEELNLTGRHGLERMPFPRPLSAEQFEKMMNDGAVAIDVRGPESIAAAAIPGSIGIPADMLAAFAGWFIPYDVPIALVADTVDQTQTAVRHLVRLGYDDVQAQLSGGIAGWETSGRPFHHIPAVYAGRLVRMLRDREITLLDVRGIDEYQKRHLPGSMNIYIGQLPQNLGRIPGDRPVVTFCGSGRRALIAATILKNAGLEDVRVCFGSMRACMSLGCEMAKGAENA